MQLDGYVCSSKNYFFVNY